MPENLDLDTRIRELVARAVADAPSPPDIDPTALPELEPGSDRRRWWIGGGAAILAAAALVTALVLVGDTEDSVSTPGTEPTVAPTPVPTVTVPTTAAPTTAAPTTAAPTTTTSPPAVGPGAVLTAGPSGVVVHRGQRQRTLTSEPMVIALAAPDGRVIVQRHAGDGAGQGWGDADTAPLVLGDDGSLRPLFDTVDWDGGVVLHDVEVVDGRLLLLFSLQVAMNVNPENADETLYVIDLDSAERTEVAADVGGWEFGTSRLHLATTGLIVGEESAGASRGIFIDDVPIPGRASPLPTPADLGLEESYGDCSICPRTFTVSPDGRTIAWIDPADDGTANDLVVRSLDDGAESRSTLHEDVPATLLADIDVGADRYVLSFTNFGAEQPIPRPVTIPTDDPSAAPTVLTGTTATVAATALG
jgi:hypothetical protein